MSLLTIFTHLSKLGLGVGLGSVSDILKTGARAPTSVKYAPCLHIWNFLFLPKSLNMWIEIKTSSKKKKTQNVTVDKNVKWKVGISIFIYVFGYMELTTWRKFSLPYSPATTKSLPAK